MTYHVGLDGAVGGGVRDAGEGEARAHLVVIEERLVGLVDGPRGDLARAGRARARAAGVGEVDASLLFGRAERVPSRRGAAVGNPDAIGETRLARVVQGFANGEPRKIAKPSEVPGGSQSDRDATDRSRDGAK